MKALTIRQPWAWCFLHGKDIENRSWSTRYRGPFLIHAARPPRNRVFEHDAGWIHLHTGLLVPPQQDLQYRGIVARAELVDVVRESNSPWFQGPFGWVVRNVEPMPFIPLRGGRAWFDVDDLLVATALSEAASPDQRRRAMNGVNVMLRVTSVGDYYRIESSGPASNKSAIAEARRLSHEAPVILFLWPGMASMFVDGEHFNARKEAQRQALKRKDRP